MQNAFEYLRRTSYTEMVRSWSPRTAVIPAMFPDKIHLYSAGTLSELMAQRNVALFLQRLRSIQATQAYGTGEFYAFSSPDEMSRFLVRHGYGTPNIIGDNIPGDALSIPPPAFC